MAPLNGTNGLPGPPVRFHVDWWEGKGLATSVDPISLVDSQGLLPPKSERISSKRGHLPHESNRYVG